MDKKKWGACKAVKNLDETQYNKTRDGFAAVCKQCSAQRAQKRKEKKNCIDSDDEDLSSDDNSDEDLRMELGNVKLDDFITAVRSAEESIHSFAALVEMADSAGADGRERANGLACQIWNELKYRFVYVIW